MVVVVFIAPPFFMGHARKFGSTGRVHKKLTRSLERVTPSPAASYGQGVVVVGLANRPRPLASPPFSTPFNHSFTWPCQLRQRAGQLLVRHTPAHGWPAGTGGEHIVVASEESKKKKVVLGHRVVVRPLTRRAGPSPTESRR